MPFPVGFVVVFVLKTECRYLKQSVVIGQGNFVSLPVGFFEDGMQMPETKSVAKGEGSGIILKTECRYMKQKSFASGRGVAERFVSLPVVFCCLFVCLFCFLFCLLLLLLFCLFFEDGMQIPETQSVASGKRRRRGLLHVL